MKFSRVFLNRLQGSASAADTVVVIDILRSFTVAAIRAAGAGFRFRAALHGRQLAELAVRRS
jgi:hypothetical protein